MDAGTIIDLVADAGSLGKIPFSARVLFWWEVQAARGASVVVADIVTKSFFDRSKFMRLMVDAILVSVQTDGRTMSSDDRMGKRWSQCLHPMAIKPIYDAYVGACHPSSQELMEFREKVEKYFSGGDGDDSGIFIAPPEVFEVFFLQKCGGLTLSEIRGLTYDKFRKYIIVMEGTGPSIPHAMPTPPPQGPASSAGVSGIPLSVLTNPNLTAAEAKRQSIGTISDAERQGGFGRPPE